MDGSEALRYLIASPSVKRIDTKVTIIRGGDLGVEVVVVPCRRRADGTIGKQPDEPRYFTDRDPEAAVIRAAKWVQDREDKF